MIRSAMQFYNKGEKMKKLICLWVFAVLLVGCAGKPVVLDNLSKNVRVVKSDPGPNYIEIGPITAQDGKGCGLFGYTGTYDQAVLKIKKLAVKQDGDYVQIFTIREPHFRPGCYDNAYTISGTLFKKSDVETADLTTVSQESEDTAGDMTVYDRLRELMKLKNEGVISQEEFNQQKALLLAKP